MPAKKTVPKQRTGPSTFGFRSGRFRISWVLLILLLLLALVAIALPGHARIRVPRGPYAKVRPKGKGPLTVGAYAQVSQRRMHEK